MTRTVTAQLTSWPTIFEIALHLSADTAWRSMLMPRFRNVRVSYGLVSSQHDDLRERNLKIAAELALATCNCAITVRHGDQFAPETELDKPTIRDIWARGFMA